MSRALARVLTPANMPLQAHKREGAPNKRAPRDLILLSAFVFAGGNACQPTTMQVTVLTIPETVWISRVTICPTAFRSLAETMAIMS